MNHDHNFLTSAVRRMFVAIAAMALMFSAGTLSATCGTRSGATTSPNLLALANLGTQNSGNSSIVGLWHVTYTAEGQLFYEAFDMWHSDGTEVESANLSPIEGNFCMGVWKYAGSSIHLNHVGWGFDNNGNPVGMFTITERNTIAGDSYKGTFDYKAYDLNGNLVQEVTGTLAATRIGVN
jgi:hypothetical protein